MCSSSDESSDPINPKFPGRKWGYPIRNEGDKNEGTVCFYCMRVYEGRYKLQIRVKFVEMPKYLGANQERWALFSAYLAKCIEHLQKVGLAHKGKMPWTRFEQEHSEHTLTIRSRKQSEMIEPEDAFMHLADYIHAHGDPSSNGKGHSTCKMNGQEIVIIPGNKVGRLRRSSIVQGDIETKVACSSTATTGEDQLEEMQSALMQGMFSGPATGVNLDAMLGTPSAIHFLRDCGCADNIAETACRRQLAG